MGKLSGGAAAIGMAAALGGCGRSPEPIPPPPVILHQIHVGGAGITHYYSATPREFAALGSSPQKRLERLRRSGVYGPHQVGWRTVAQGEPRFYFPVCGGTISSATAFRATGSEGGIPLRCR